MEAPFAGPAMVAVTEDGGFAALGWDERQIFWLKTWEGRSAQPEGSRWQRIGTFDDLFPAAKQKRSSRAAKRAPRRSAK